MSDKASVSEQGLPVVLKSGPKTRMWANA